MTTIHARSALLAHGYTEAEIRRHLGDDWSRIALGRYVTEPLSGLTPERRHAVITRAELSRFSSPHVMASHTSAAALHGLPLLDSPLDLVEVIRHGRSGNRRSHRAHVRAAAVPDIDRTCLGATPCTTVARTLVDLARHARRTTAVAAADHALRQGLVTGDRVVEALRRMGPGAGPPRARRVLMMADGRAESPGESKQRLILTDAGLPEQELQVRVLDDDQSLIGRVDGAMLRQGLLLEFDGEEKYTKYRRRGERTSDAVMREKRRENQLRALGWSVVRFDWADLSCPQRMVDQVRTAISQRRGLPTPRGSVECSDPVRICF